MTRKRTPDILDWEELEQAPNVRGAFSFLTIPGQVISIDRKEEVQRSAEPLRNDQTSTKDITSTVDRPPTVDRTTAVPITLTEDKVSTVDGMRSPDRMSRSYRVHRCRSVQDGHSHGETILYDTLWRLGSAVNEHREVTIGWDAMGRAARMSDKAAKRNLNQLTGKLAVELVAKEDSARRVGRTYRIFSFDQILARRKAAGMEYVVRDKGVRFVTVSGEPLGGGDGLGAPRMASTKDITSPVDRASTECEGQRSALCRRATSLMTVDRTPTVDKTSTVSGDKTSPVSVDKTSPLIGNYLGNSLAGC